MITIKQFMEIVNYRITEGSDYGWNCYGSKAYCLDSYSGDIDGHTVGIVFDTWTQVVYEAVAYDYKNGRAYRMINPDFKTAHAAEYKDRDIIDMAWEQDDGTVVRYNDLEVDEDFIQKATAIVNNEEYDDRIQVPVEFTDEELLTYMKMAHERDITFNQFVEQALKEAIRHHDLSKP